MNKKRWTEMDRERNGPVSLYDFAFADDAMDAILVDESAKKGGWRISDDSVIGGYSQAKFQLIQTPEDYQRILRGETPLCMLPDRDDGVPEQQVEQDSEDEEPEEKEEFIPFVRWQGTIDTTVNKDGSSQDGLSGIQKQDVQRSGFCAIRSPEYPFGGANLGGRYNGLEITCRSDGRPYSVNLKVESFIADDLFQTFISIPPTIPRDEDGNQLIQPENGGEFDKVVLLFQHFIVTSGGRMRATQRELDNAVKIESIGFTLMDGMDGDFQFDLARIRAVNYDETGVVGNVD